MEKIPAETENSKPPQSQPDSPPKRSNKPDHGQNFVPGSEAAPKDVAPQPLDHFKRGYKERAELRDREMSHLNMDFEQSGNDQKPHSSGRHYNAGSKFERDSRKKYPRDNYYGNPNTSFDSGRRADDITFHGQIGFEVNSLVDRLSSPGCRLNEELDKARELSPQSFESGKAITSILSHLARRRKMGVALSVWQWMQESGIHRNVFHYNSLISVCEKMKDWKRAVDLLKQMEVEGVKKNEVTFSSAISACEKSGNWSKAIDLLQRMKVEGIERTTIAYNAAISACEKGLNPSKALEIFDQMKKEGVRPTVITYSALISACEKGQQWKLALEVLNEMKEAGHGANVIAYSAAISALSKGQQWEKALDLFREIERSGGKPSVVTYNATMTALEKGLQWERALDLFDEMKYKRLPVTVVSYGSAISACEKGYQWQQCLDYLDEMSEIGIKKNVIIFGAAMSCMEKCCRADIAFQLMERMKIEGVNPNVHIYNSAISACARCNLWKKGLELFHEMGHVGVVRDVVTYNAVLDAVSCEVKLARKLFQEGVERGFYARVSRLGTQWLELDLHFLSLGGGEIALGWWFEECLVPYLGSHDKLAAVKSIDIVTGYGKTRLRGARQGGDGMRKRVTAMLHYMNVREIDQPNKGRIHIDKDALMKEVEKNGGKIIFDADGYRRFRERETTANAMPNVPQIRRKRWGDHNGNDTKNSSGHREKSYENRNYEREKNHHDSSSYNNSRDSERRRSDSPEYNRGRRHNGDDSYDRHDRNRDKYDDNSRRSENYYNNNNNNKYRREKRRHSRSPSPVYQSSTGRHGRREENVHDDQSARARRDGRGYSVDFGHEYHQSKQSTRSPERLDYNTGGRNGNSQRRDYDHYQSSSSKRFKSDRNDQYYGSDYRNKQQSENNRRDFPSGRSSYDSHKYSANSYVHRSDSARMPQSSSPSRSNEYKKRDYHESHHRSQQYYDDDKSERDRDRYGSRRGNDSDRRGDYLSSYSRRSNRDNDFRGHRRY